MIYLPLHKTSMKEELVQLFDKQYHKPTYIDIEFSEAFDSHSIKKFGLKTENLLYLKVWIGNNPSLKLIYRASRDGFSKDTFSKHCDEKGRTILIVKSLEGKVFGCLVNH